MPNDGIKDAADTANKANEKYFDWVRLMLSLATGSLAALIALQDNYVPRSPNAVYLLWGSWISLASSVLAAAIVLRGEGLAFRKLSRAMATATQQPQQGRVHLGRPPLLCDCAAWALPWLLAISLILLCAFAISNTGIPSTSADTGPATVPTAATANTNRPPGEP